MSGVDALASRAHGWLARNLKAFLDAPGGDQDDVALKRLGELAMLGAALGDDGRRWLEIAWRGLGQGERLLALLPAIPTVSLVYLPFRWTGMRSAKLERALAEPSWRAKHRDWSAFGRVAVGEALAAVGVPAPWQQRPILDKLDLFAAPTPEENGLRAQLMAHLVFWRTALGRDPGALGDADRRKLAAALEPWCLKLVRSGDVDSLGEVLAAACCVRLPAPAWAWGKLLTAQQADGRMPLVAGSAAGPNDFHPTLVAAIAGTLAADAPKLARRFAATAVELHAHLAD